MNRLVKKSEKLLEQCTECSVGAVTENGYPRICILKPIKTDGIKRLWFSTGTSSRKVKDYCRCGKAGVTFYRGGDSVTLLGTMFVVTDKNEKDEVWQDWLCKHFPDGFKDDPEYCVIRFEATEVTVYIDEEFETFTI